MTLLAETMKHTTDSRNAIAALSAARWRVAMVGIAPAIINAIYHATGRRVRELPATPDKLI